MRSRPCRILKLRRCRRECFGWNEQLPVVGALLRCRVSATVARPMKHDCPHCRLTIKFKGEHAARLTQCDVCGNTVQLPSHEGRAKAESVRVKRALARCVWGLTLLVILIQGFVAMGRFVDAQSAPQQCAAAAISGFWLLVTYTFAKALTGTAATGE